MRKIILSVLVIGAIMSSCGNNGKKAVTKDAEKVDIVKTTKTVTFNTIKEGSSLSWRASHLGGLQERYGKIYFKNASFLVNKETLTNISAEIDMATLTVESFPKGAEEIAKLAGHLKSADFFNVEKNPTSKFELTNLESTQGTYNAKITGNLTIKGITKSITFNANISVSDNEVSIKSEDFSINRIDWKLSYNVEGTEGVPVDYIIANDIGFTIDLTVTK